MYPAGIFDLIKNVISSWQVIAVTIGIVIYLNIVFYAARYYRAPKIRSMVKKLSFKRKKPDAAPEAGHEEIHDSNDELGLEE